MPGARHHSPRRCRANRQRPVGRRAGASMPATRIWARAACGCGRGAGAVRGEDPGGPRARLGGSAGRVWDTGAYGGGRPARSNAVPRLAGAVVSVVAMMVGYSAAAHLWKVATHIRRAVRRRYICQSALLDRLQEWAAAPLRSCATAPGWTAQSGPAHSWPSTLKAKLNHGRSRVCGPGVPRRWRGSPVGGPCLMSGRQLLDWRSGRRVVCPEGGGSPGRGWGCVAR